MEVREVFSSCDEWREWFRLRPDLRDVNLIAEHVRCAKQVGLTTKFFGKVHPDEIEIRGSNFREQFMARNLNARQRALLELLVEELDRMSVRSPAIYAPEAITPLAMTLRGRFSRFVGSEYTEAAEIKSSLFPILIEDLADLSFPASSFDFVITSDVLEHVPNIPTCLEEIARVLRPGGVMLSTFPFTWSQSGNVRAVLHGDDVEFVLDPEYHGNPVDPGAGSLVFTVPGWDIVNDCKAAGFAKVDMIMLASASKGIFGGKMAIINVLRACR